MYYSFLSNSILRIIINFCKNYSLNSTDFENNTNLYESCLEIYILHK